MLCGVCGRNRLTVTGPVYQEQCEDTRVLSEGFTSTGTISEEGQTLGNYDV